VNRHLTKYRRYAAKIGVDVGGRVTDLYAYDDQNQRKVISKVPSKPKDFTVGVMSAISNDGIEFKDIDYLIHCSMIATKATIERTYPKTLFVTI
jgi:N-methylhydantoinase A/oxoprolinase/acetone carboxylase beta subunit